MVFARSGPGRNVYVIKCRVIEETLYQHPTIKEGGKQSLSFQNSVFASAAALASHCMCQFCISLATRTLRSAQGPPQAALGVTEIHFLLLPEGDPGAWNLGTAFCPAAGPGLFHLILVVTCLKAENTGFCYLPEELGLLRYFLIP